MSDFATIARILAAIRQGGQQKPRRCGAFLVHGLSAGRPVGLHPSSHCARISRAMFAIMFGGTLMPQM